MLTKTFGKNSKYTWTHGDSFLNHNLLQTNQVPKSLEDKQLPE